MARKTSSSEGACSCRVSIAMPSASSARTTSASCASPPSSRAAAATRRGARARGRSAPAPRRAARARPGRAAPLRPSAGRSRPSARPGVPSATMWPWSMIPTRSASASASSRYWVVRKTVTPSSTARRATSSQSAVRLWMSRPVVGSSRKRMRGRCDERQRQVEPPLHPARVAAHLAVGGLGQADPLQQLLPALRRRSALRQPVQGGLQAHVLAPGQQRVERGLLQRGADRGAHPRPLLDDVEARHTRRPRRRRQQRGQHQHRGRLAGAVGAEEAVDLARLDPQVDPVDRPRPVLELAHEPLDLDALASIGNHARQANQPRPPASCIKFPV